jgi:hypothetical protein
MFKHPRIGKHGQGTQEKEDYSDPNAPWNPDSLKFKTNSGPETKDWSRPGPKSQQIHKQTGQVSANNSGIIVDFVPGTQILIEGGILRRIRQQTHGQKDRQRHKA